MLQAAQLHTWGSIPFAFAHIRIVGSGGEGLPACGLTPHRRGCVAKRMELRVFEEGGALSHARSSLSHSVGLAFFLRRRIWAVHSSRVLIRAFLVACLFDELGLCIVFSSCRRLGLLPYPGSLAAVIPQ